MRIYKIAKPIKQTPKTQKTQTQRVFKPVLTSDEMESFIDDNNLRNCHGVLDCDEMEQIANASDKWELTELPLSLFGWVVDSSYKKNRSIGLPPIVLFDGENYEVLDGKHRIGMAKDRGEQTITVYLGKVFDD